MKKNLLRVFKDMIFLNRIYLFGFYVRSNECVCFFYCCFKRKRSVPEKSVGGALVLVRRF